jgi:predicted PurR-regulated permease PerM
MVVPSYYLADSMFDTTRNLVHSVEQGTFHLPPLSERVKALPVVGQALTDFWSLAQTNSEAAIKKAGPELVDIARNFGSRLVGVALTVLLFSISLVIAGVFMSKAESSVEAVRKFARRLVGDKGEEWVKLSGDTISSVVAGVLGVAVIQAFLLAVGMFWLQVPGAGLLTLIALLFAIVQVPNLITMVPVIAYVYSTHDATPATIFAVWSIFGATSNLWLGPMLMGRGVNIPMLVVFLGAIGGMIYQGIIGLFVGAVVLALAYTLYTSWIEEEVL